MKKIIFGQFFKLLILASSISLLAACGASDAIDAANALDDLNDIGETGEVLGNMTVSGTDESTIGTVFEPRLESGDTNVTALVESLIALVFIEADFDLSILAGEATFRTLVVTFDADAPGIITYGVAVDSNRTFTYTVDCSENTCNATINRADSTITFTNAVLFATTGAQDDASNATISLSGTLRYVGQ